MSVVRVNRPGAGTRFGMLIAGMPLLAGCLPHKTTKVPPPAATQVSVLWSADAVTRRVRELSRNADTLSSDARQLPGRDPADHVRIMRQIFGDLIQTLPLLADPAEDRGLSTKLKSIQESRAKLSGGTGDLIPEPIIDNGLKAAQAALGDISQGEQYKQADLGAAIDKLSAQLNRQETERNADLHRVDVADSVDQISLLISKMAVTLSGRFAAEKPVGPTSLPAGTTNPAATMPAEEMKK